MIDFVNFSYFFTINLFIVKKDVYINNKMLPLMINASYEDSDQVAITRVMYFFRNVTTFLSRYYHHHQKRKKIYLTQILTKGCQFYWSGLVDKSGDLVEKSNQIMLLSHTPYRNSKPFQNL